MKLKFILLFIFMFILPDPCMGQTTIKITGMTADASPTSDDLVWTINDPASTKGSRKVTLGNLPKAFTSANGLSLISAADYAAMLVLLGFDQDVSADANPSFSTLNIIGANALNLGTSRTNNGQVRFKSGTALNDYYFSIVGGNFTANLVWNLPLSVPGGANYLLNVDADGTMGYTDPASIGGTQASLHIDDILTTIGVASEATHLGTFTGSTISDNVTAKAAIQALETAVETKSNTSSPTFTGKVTTAASAAVAGAGFNLPHGVVPNSPANGDCWTTSAGGLYCQINGSTIGPYAAAGGSPALDDVTNPDAAKTFTLLDNNASALSFGATGAADILKIGTLDAGPGVTITGFLTTTGLDTSGTISSGAGGFTVAPDGDVIGKSFTSAKVNGTAGTSLLY